MRKAAGIALGVVFVLGVVASLAARNSSGTYSLPAGNPVVSGTAITSTWANNTLSDLGTELTDSLSRTGKGPMSAALELVNGTAAVPAMSFDSDTDTGIYRIGADNLGISIGGTKRWDMATAGSTLTGTLTCSGATTLQSTLAVTGAVTPAAGVTVTQSVANTAATTTTGNGTGAGLVSTGGATGNGINAAAGGSPSGDVNTRWGLSVTEGHIKLGESNPASTTAFNNTITPMNTVKVQGHLTSTGGTWSVASGYNITSVSCSLGIVTVNFGDDMSNTNYTVVGNSQTSAEGFTNFGINARATGFITIQSNFDTWDGATVVVDSSDLCNGSNIIDFVVFGAN